MEKKKVTIKDILNMNITESKRVVKNLTDKQLQTLRLKLERFHAIADDEQDEREKEVIEKELDEEVEEVFEEVLEETDQELTNTNIEA